MAWPSEAGAVAQPTTSRAPRGPVLPRPRVYPAHWVSPFARFVRGVGVRRVRPVALRPRPFVIAHPAFRGKFYHSARGLYRVFNAAVYRFYRSNSAPPKETDTPFATNATLPHEPADLYADGTWYLSASYFNGVIDSGFLPLGPNGETYLRLDLSGGAVTGSPPGGPNNTRLELAASGVVRVVAFYLQPATGTLRADQWAIARTFDGSTPPADTPDATVVMPKSGMAVLDYALAGQIHGTTVKVRLQTRRNDGTDASPAWVYSADSVVLTATADAQGPAAPGAADSWPGPLPESF